MRIFSLAAALSLAAGSGAARAAEPAAAPAVLAAPSAVKRIPLTLASGRKLIVDVMDTEEGRERGLMFRRKLPKDYGMLFVFPTEIKLQFWMKNTFVGLDIVFIGQDKRVTVVHKRVPASKEGMTDEQVARVAGTGQYVLELPAGAAERLGVRKGQILRFATGIPAR